MNLTPANVRQALDECMAYVRTGPTHFKRPLNLLVGDTTVKPSGRISNVATSSIVGIEGMRSVVGPHGKLIIEIHFKWLKALTPTHNTSPAIITVDIKFNDRHNKDLKCRFRDTIECDPNILPHEFVKRVMDSTRFMAAYHDFRWTAFRSRVDAMREAANHTINYTDRFV